MSVWKKNNSSLETLMDPHCSKRMFDYFFVGLEGPTVELDEAAVKKACRNHPQFVPSIGSLLDPVHFPDSTSCFGAVCHAQTQDHLPRGVGFRRFQILVQPRKSTFTWDDSHRSSHFSSELKPPTLSTMKPSLHGSASWLRLLQGKLISEIPEHGIELMLVRPGV